MTPCHEIICCAEPMSTYKAGGGDIPQMGVLLNLDFTSVDPSDKTGAAAIGLTDVDFWNAFLPAQAGAALSLKWSDGSASPVTIQSTGSAGGAIVNNGNTDPMVATCYENGNPNHEKTFTIAGLEEGSYDLYLYGYGTVPGSTFGTPNAVGEWLIMINGVQWPNNLAFYFCMSNPNPPPWTNGQNFVRIPGIPITPGDLLQIRAFYEGGTRFGRTSGLQLVKSPPTDNPESVVQPDIFAADPAYFFGGASQVAGTYRATYLNGALGYNATLKFTVNLDPTLAGQAFVIVHSGGTEITGPWYRAVPSTQADAEAALGGAYMDFTHTGGPIFMYLKDAIYGDNVAGSPNPRFSLQRLS